jgi:exopolysaccharide biosynthesis polyprenyl glycosylphosphotransferase
MFVGDRESARVSDDQSTGAGGRPLGRGDAAGEHSQTLTGSGPGASSLADVARRNKGVEIARAAEMAAETAASGRDEDAVFDSTSVRPMRQLRPVPPLPGAAARDLAKPVPPLRPVYDPFSARRRQAPEWMVRYTVGLVAGDFVAVVVAVVAALALAGASTVAVGTALALIGMWPALVAMSGGYAERRLGAGSDEFRRVFLSGVLAVAVLSTSAVVFALPGLRAFVLVGAPLATGLSLLGRLVLRRRLHAARRDGAMTKQVVVVGREIAVADLVRRLRRDPAAGLSVVGACVPNPPTAGLLAEAGVPVLAGMQDAVAALESVRADAVVVASASETAGQYLRDLSWRLEGTNIEILVAPGLVEVAPDRLQVRPTTTFPLIHVREPEFRGMRRVVKSVFDRCLAALLLVLGAPVFLLLALAVRCTSSGPMFYRHRRVGMRGQEFELLKFRSMVMDADQRVEDLMAMNEGNEVQFKMRRDPRVTKVGALLRRSSLDELPQLINVLRGDMSIVGPRPHVTREVEQYGPDMHRRLLVKPGITGLWQVSGRSNLTWDESVELDVRYVENWSLSLDLRILWRTGRAVLRASGAY